MDQVIKEYVEFRGGKRVIKTILVANNGLAAVRFIRRLREWSYKYLGHERALHFVAMPTPEDIEANAEYFRLADEFVVVPGGSNKNNFAKVDLIVDVAKRVGADAVWPGWGHASENPALPNSLEKEGIIFMGPSGDSMDSVGDKICANLLAQSVGVNVIPWSGSGLKSDGVKLSKELITQATLANVDDAVKRAEKVGFPLMIKASEGGGGKGIRMVKNMDELRVGFDQVSKEVVGSPIFIQKLGVNARHLEVQVVADEYGQAISLYGRDCSVQRRHQKIIEEGPVKVCSTELRQELEQGAVRLAKFVSYRSAGTVEFLYSADTKEYSFLEVNPRLQVEHPVTEGITGVCVPAIQLNVAMGIPLHAIPDIREFYMLDPADITPIDFDTATPKPPVCHTIAARITAENPEDGFKPTSGKIHEFFYRPVNGVSASFSVSCSGAVHQFADSQFGHLFSHAPTREQAAKNLLVALQEITIRGEISNNTAGLQYILESEEFKKDTHSTGWLDVLIANNEKMVPSVADKLAVVCGATVTARNLFLQQRSEVLSYLDRGVVPDASVTGYSHHSFTLIFGDFKYAVQTSICSDMSGIQSSVEIAINGSRLQAQVIMMHDGGLKLLFDSSSHVVYSERTATGLKVLVDGKVCFFPDDADPTALQTISAGKLVSFLVEDGETIQPGQPYAEIEVMKTIMPLLALNGPGVVTTLKTPGVSLEAGDVLARLQLADGAQVKMANPFTGTFPEYLLNGGVPASSGVVGRLALVMEAASALNQGYGNLFPVIPELLRNLLDPQLPSLEAQEVLAQGGPLPQSTVQALTRLANRDIPPGASVHQLEKQLVQDITAGLASLSSSSEEEVKAAKVFFTKYVKGQLGALVQVITQLLQDYLEVENYFDLASSYQDAILELRDSNKTDLEKVAGYALSHSQLKSKNKTVMQMLQYIGDSGSVSDYVDILAKISELSGAEYAEVCQKSKELLFSVDQAQRAADQTRRRMKNASNDNINMSFKGLSIGSMTRTFSYNSASSVASFDSDTEDMDSVHEEDDMEDYDFGDNPVPRINIAAIFDYDNRTEQAKAVKEYFETFGINNAIQSSGKNLVKMQIGDGATALVASSLMMVPEILQKIVEDGLQTEVNILLPAECATEEEVRDLMSQETGELLQSEVQKVCITLLSDSKSPVHISFGKQTDFQEQKGFRGIAPALALQMELDRLCNFEILSLSHSPKNIYQQGTPDYHLQVLYAKELLENTPPGSRNALDVRIFVRAAVYSPAFFIVPGCAPLDTAPVPDATPSSPRLTRKSSFHTFDPEEGGIATGIPESNVLIDMMRNLELMVGSKNTASNFMFINLTSATTQDMPAAQATIAFFVKLYFAELARLKVTTIEVKIGSGRIVAYNPAGSRFKVDRHMDDEISGEAEHPYPLLNRMQRKKMVAQRAGSTYVYDFLEIFQDLVSEQDPLSFRSGMGMAVKEEPAFQATELVVNAEGNLEESKRPHGFNDCGMVAFRCWMRTPECRNGRTFILVGSDLSHQSGSFSPKEDILYYKALELCRQEGIPSVYISANSGARIGVNEDVKKKIQVAWVDPQHPSKGFEYIYLSEEDYKSLGKDVHAVKLVTDTNEVRYQILDVFGGYGVECLQGSGMIANVTSAAYEETVTISYITGRSVGIGAYISRLSQRVIQHSDAPIILTGAAALNKVLGRQVYSSNAQIGGPKVMHHNGVSHLVVDNDVEGVGAVLKWLSYIPVKRGASLPIHPSSDPIDRRVEWIPPASGPYDPRQMLMGCEERGEFRRGFFDQGSFTEVLENWGKTVVAGRARLGGLPCGVIAVETRMQERVQPADPGFPGSTTQVSQQAGQVWFPDSAYKTASSINDFNREGLPLFIFANWRGFAGGQRDMFDEVLKYGSYIVDALRTYKQPVFVYLPCGAELRGGAWVVIDPTINPQMMRMYSSENAKGNVLEPEGIVEIKFRKPDLLKAMKRNDPVYAAMDEGSPEAKLREKEMLPIYTQMAVHFAALHDTPGVMKQKGVVTDIIPWAQSRSHFYAALRFRLAEVALGKMVHETCPSMSQAAVQDLLETEMSPLLTELANGTCTMQDVRITSAVEKLQYNDSVEQVASMPTDAVLAGLLKEHSPEDLIAMLAAKTQA